MSFTDQLYELNKDLFDSFEKELKEQECADKERAEKELIEKERMKQEFIEQEHMENLYEYEIEDILELKTIFT